MSTVAAKSPKKRKSLSNQAGTPSKTPKIEKVQTPKTNATPSNGKQSANPGKNADKKRKSLSNQAGTPITPEVEKVQTPKTNITPSNDKQTANQGKNANNKKSKEKTPVKNEPIENGDGKKLIKFEGTKTLGTEKLTRRQRLINKLKEISKIKGQDAVVKVLNGQMEGITSRSEITKSQRKKLKDLKRLFKLITGTSPSIQVQSKKAPQGSKKAKVQMKNAGPNVKTIKTEKKEEKKKAQTVIKEEIEDDDDDEVEDNVDDEVEDNEDSADTEESDDDEESEDDEDEADKQIEKKSKKVIESKAKIEPDEKTAKNASTKNSRYVLFVGNIAYDTTREEIIEHFKRVGEITDVRIPLHKESNKPRGFAYVELPNEASYQKALDLNGSQLKNRKIHVEYTQGGKKKSEDSKKEIKSKNFKLHAMRKQGQFGKGNKPQFKGKGKPAN